jgi:hypothetical protein
MKLLKQSTTYNLQVFMTDSADHVSGKTGLTLTITASKDGAAFASITPAVTETSNGFYSLALTTTHTNTLGDLAIHVTGSGADPTDLVCQVIAFDLADADPSVDVTKWNGTAVATPTTAGVPRVDVKAMEANVLTAAAINADAITAAKVASDVSAEIADAVWDEAQAGHVTAGTFGLYLDTEVSGVGGGSLTAADIADAVWDEVRSGHTTSGTFGQGVASVMGNVNGNITGTVASVVGSVGGSVASIGSNGITTSSIQSGAIARTSFTQHVLDLFGEVRGRVTAASSGHTSTVLALDSGASSVDDYYNDHLVGLTGGTGSGQYRTITDYEGATKLATVDRAWTTTPDNTTIYHILAAPAGGGSLTAASVADAVWDEARSGHVAAGSFGEGVASVQGAVTGAVGSVTGAVGSVTGNVGGDVVGAVASVTGNVGGNVTGSVGSVVGAVGSVTGNVGGNVTGSIGSVATGGIAAASFAADAIDAAAVASDLLAAIADAVWDEVVESTFTARQYLRGYASALLAKAAGFAGTSRTFRDIGDTKNRITATVDSSGRSAVSLDLT